MNIDSLSKIKIVDFEINYSKPFVYIESNWWAVLCVIIIVMIFILFYRRFFRHGKQYCEEIEIKILGSSFKIKRTYENLFIANRIYIELVTRKVALEFEEDNDVISEVYDSWYKIFNIIRDEIKSLPGNYLSNKKSSKELIDLTIAILNKGLRPHLTKYQAEFRRWYENELASNKSRVASPQQIQKRYSRYRELVDDIKFVNGIMLNYSKELEKFVSGEKLRK